jgi:hypothetical protein
VHWWFNNSIKQPQQSITASADAWNFEHTYSNMADSIGTMLIISHQADDGLMLDDLPA